MRDIIWAIGASNSLKLRSYLIIVIFYVFGYTSNINLTENSNIMEQSCLTDELYGGITEREFNNLIERRTFVRGKMQNNLFRNEIDSIFIVPVVFHNIYNIVNGTAIGSYCDFGFDDDDIVEGNDQDICNDRIARSV